MFAWFRRSLLAQLLGIYLLFVALVLGCGVAIRVLVQRQLWQDTQNNNLALAQAVAREASQRIIAARTTIIRLVTSEGPSITDLASRAKQGNADAINQMRALLRDFKNANRDASVIYWLDEVGVMRLAVPEYPATIGQDFSRQPTFQNAKAKSKDGVLVEYGLDFTTLEGVVVISLPLYDFAGKFHGMMALNVPVERFNSPLQALAQEHRNRDDQIFIHLVDLSTPNNTLIASSDFGRMELDPSRGERLPLGCGECTQRFVDVNQDDWLLSTTALKGENWAVIVRRPTQSALATLNSFNTWLWLAALLFGLGGVMFWVVLMRRVIRPLQTLAHRYSAKIGDRAMNIEGAGGLRPPPLLRSDEIGDLSHSLSSLEQSVADHIGELNTLLVTSRAVVGTLEPQTVLQTIINAARQLVSMDAAAVLAQDANQRLRVVASEGRSEPFIRMTDVAVDDPVSPSAKAFRTGQPVQITAADEASEIALVSFKEGFRSVLAIPILSRHVGGIVLHVARYARLSFSENEVNLLSTFANYAALAWEHAVLYERSDERLREVAAENQRLYRQAVEDKQTLLAAVGHELRTPLTTIKGNASTLLQNDVTWSIDDQRHFLGTISDEADRMAELLNHLLDLARQETGLLALKRAPYALSELVNRALKRVEIGSNQIVKNLPAQLPKIDVDSARIEVVLRNLLANALEYGGGWVQIAAQSQHGQVVISISDNGPGIAAEELQYLFERFYRARHGLERRSGGTGLGLAICRAFVVAHGGKIWVDSNASGTTVSFSLPV